jgi:serine/threonine-protein kinase
VLREIGRGGMGTVYLAERSDVARRVALKLVRDPMAAPERVERFRLERRVLARLDHPHIARLLDAGVAPDAGTPHGGTPWFAMELVEGAPIDRACDARRLTVAERLALFEQVCEAVQYAHEHLVVHRDLKPSNILVTDDGRVKLLDFGIAKLLDDAAGEGEALTGTGVRLLTPEYAAPEQLRGAPVTTATDVYALGVVLYELLTGCHPQRARRRTPGASTDAPWYVLPSEPAPPSAVAARAESAAASAARGTTPPRLARRLRGDLDTVILRALAAEPARRYASAHQLLDDLRRHRIGLPVAARRTTWRYRARKFVARNRASVAALASLVVLLAGVAGWTTYQQAAVVRERDRARQEAARGRLGATFFGELLMAATPNGIGPGGTVADLLALGAARADTLRDTPELHAWMLTALGFAYLDRGEYARAHPALDAALTIKRRIHPGDHVDVGQSLLALGRLAEEQGNLVDAERILREQVAMDRRLPGDGPTDLVKGLVVLGRVMRARGDPVGAERALREAVARVEALGRPVLWHGRALGGLGAALVDQGRLAEAEAALVRGIAIVGQAGGPTHPELLVQRAALAEVRRGQGRLAEADALAGEAAAGARRALGPVHPRVALVMQALARVREARGDAPGADTAYREALAIQRAALPAGSAVTAATLGALGRLLVAGGRHGEAEPLLREALETNRRMLLPGARETAANQRALDACRVAAARLPAGPPSAGS